MDFDSLKIGYSKSLKQKVTDKMVTEFARITGDSNKVHLDEEYASRTMFKQRIAHGFLYGSFISKMLGTKFPGNGTVYQFQEMKFLKPVYINDILKVSITVLEKLSKGRLKLKTDIFKPDGELALEGIAIISLPKNWDIISDTKK